MSTKRFRIAFSFAGEKRDFVAHIAAILADRFGESAILYDKFSEAEFAQWKLGLKLANLYRNESELIVVIVCLDYSEKKWCGLEWACDSWHAHVRQRQPSDALPLRPRGTPGHL